MIALAIGIACFFVAAVVTLYAAYWIERLTGQDDLLINILTAIGIYLGIMMLYFVGDGIANSMGL